MSAAGIPNSIYFSWPEEVISTLKNKISAYTEGLIRSTLQKENRANPIDLSFDSWANVLREGEYNTLHTHPNAVWSGVYYVNGNEKLDDKPFSGKLELIDPRPGASTHYNEHSTLYGRCLLSPIAGQVVIFPSWLQHQVHPYFGKTPRISIAFNVNYSL